MNIHMTVSDDQVQFLIDTGRLRLDQRENSLALSQAVYELLKDYAKFVGSGNPPEMFYRELHRLNMERLEAEEKETARKEKTNSLK